MSNRQQNAVQCQSPQGGTEYRARSKHEGKKEKKDETCENDTCLICARSNHQVLQGVDQDHLKVEGAHHGEHIVKVGVHIGGAGEDRFPVLVHSLVITPYYAHLVI